MQRAAFGDSIGAPYLEKNLASLALEGRLVLIGLIGGAKAEISLATLLLRRLQVIGSTLRALTEDVKADLVTSFVQKFGAALRAGTLAPVVDHHELQALEHQRRPQRLSFTATPPPD